MKSGFMLAAAVLAAALGGCASRASGVAPISISSAEYSHLSCEEARAQLAVARERENALTRQQNNAATADAVGVFLLFVPAGSVFGGDVEGELAQAKGEVLALERAVPQRCAVAPSASVPTPAAVADAEAAPAEALVETSPQ